MCAPAFHELAYAGCGNFAKSAVYSALSEISESGSYFEGMTAVSRNENGKITDISLNSENANRIRSEICERLNTMLFSKEFSTYFIPSGNLTGLALLSGRGFKIPVRIVPVGSVEADISSSFTQSGINQTLHTVSVSVKAKVKPLYPFSKGVCETETNVPLSETLIVGDIPIFYSGLEK